MQVKLYAELFEQMHALYSKTNTWHKLKENVKHMIAILKFSWTY